MPSYDGGRRYDVRRDPNYRVCPVRSCTRGYMLNKYKGCVDHRAVGQQMYDNGTHPESPSYRRTAIPKSSVDRPAASRPPTQPLSTPSSSSGLSSRSRVGPGKLVALGLVLWWLIATFGGTAVTEQAPGPQPRNVQVIDFDNPPSGGSCGAGSYINVDGDCIPGPVYADSPPAGATAQCADGTYSFSQHRQGTCSHHGGVASWSP